MNPTATDPLLPSAAQEDEVYGALGALLGTLEVVATDDVHPVAPIQEQRLRSALQICDRLQTYIESLLTLAADDLGSRLRRSHCAVRPMIEHAVRGALRRFEARGVSLRVPANGWGQERVFVDASRIDRTLRALAEALVDYVGQEGAIEVSVRPVGMHVVIELLGRAGLAEQARPGPIAPPLLERAARRLLELHGGGLALDRRQLAVEVLLPASERP